ncbi:MAG: peptide chain release factor aRF-1 [Candidatus Micrarchaeia archaeon]|jgi:peptide chain release factor subunit 1
MDKAEKLRYEMRRKMRALKDIRGSGTELISVYIPPTGQIADTSNKLKEEYGQAGNIKSKSTRKNVQEALDKIIQYLKIFRKPPENGLAIFCGNVSKNQGHPDIQLFSIEPPVELNVQMYRCDSSFMLDPLDSMLETSQAYGLVAIDGRDCTLAILRGKNTKVVRRLHSLAHSKVHKGGQSARRYQRIVEEEIEYYYKNVSENMDEVFLPSGIKDIIVGGPGPVKENFVKLKHFNYQFKILGVVDTGYTDEFGIKELMDNSEGIINEQESVREKVLVENFIREISREGLATYGYEKVRAAIDSSQASKALISEALNLYRISYKCTQCSRLFDALLEKDAPDAKCDQCGGKAQEISKIDAISELIELAEKRNVELDFISVETNSGQQFLSGFNGMGAFLRYR